VAQRYLNLAFGFVVKNTLYAHDVPLLFISVLGLIVFICVRAYRVYFCIRAYRVYALDLSVLTTLSFSFLNRYYAPCYKFCRLVFSFILFRYDEKFRKRSNSFPTVTSLRGG
jgi:hypothetical protein